MGFPLLTQEQESALGQGDVTILVALACADVQEHPFAIDVGDLEAQAFPQAQAAGIDEGQANAMIQGWDRTEDVARFGSGEHDRQFGLVIGAGQLEFMRPGAFEGFFPEDLDGADGLGAGLAGDFLVGFEMDEVLADLFSGDELRGEAVELAQLADAGVIGLLGAGADGQELEVIGEGF